MSLTLEYRSEPTWPPLSWIATCVRGDSRVKVRHGRQAETRPDWFCEAIWDDDFNAGAFDRTDLVFGSGARVRDAEITFVSSASTVDRLHVMRRADEVLVSNSLPCLLAAAGHSIPPDREDWFGLFVSIKNGIDHYRRLVPTDGTAPVELVYCRNLRWTGADVAESDKPNVSPDFSTFDRYSQFLVDAVARLSANAVHPARGHRYELLGTLSSGYDSSTARVIGKRFGLTSAISSRQARGESDPDDGSLVAESIGIRIDVFDRSAWKAKDRPKLPFFAGNPRGGEVFMAAAEDLLRGKVLLTGFHGDKVWGKATTALGPNIVRGDMSGLSLCEYRLHIGFIHFPLAFLGVRQIRDIHALSNSAELAPWDVPGDYSRPICRRIVEEAGVPRHAFGQRKKMASVHFGQGEAVLTEASRADYYEWLAKNWARGRFPSLRQSPVPSAFVASLRDRLWLLDKVVRTASRPLPKSVRRSLTQRLGRFQRELSRRINRPEFVFPWAIDRLCEAYASSDGGDVSSRPRS